MSTAYVVLGDPDVLLAELCPIDEQGHLLFCFAGRSRKPSSHSGLLDGPVEFKDYVMEGFASYTLSAERVDNGLRLVVSQADTTDRGAAVLWFVEKYLKSKGLTVSKSAVQVGESDH